MAVIFLVSGVGKIAAPSATIGYIAASGLPLPIASYAVSVLVEILGGLALVFGFGIRGAGFVLAAFTALTALVFHSNLADQGQIIHFTKNLAIIGGLLQLVAFGNGGAESPETVLVNGRGARRKRRPTIA
jgi:putative oxidoreductase